MPRFTKNPRSSRRGSKKRSSKYRSVNKYAQRKQIKSLATKVNRLTKENRQYGSYKYTVSMAMSGTTEWSSKLRLMDPTTWNATFGNATLVQNTSAFMLKSITLSLAFVPNNEAGLIDFTIFIASPNKENAAKVCHETDDGFQLTDGRDFINDSYGAGPLLNLSRWNVHAKRRCWTRKMYTGEGDNEVPSPTRRFTIKIPWKYKFYSATGNWRATITDKDDVNDHKHLMLFVFNNNSSGNFGFPWLYMNALYNGYAIA